MTPSAILEKNGEWSEFAYFAESVADAFTYMMTEGGGLEPEDLKAYKDIRVYQHDVFPFVIVQWYDKDGCATEVTARLMKPLFKDTWERTQKLLGTLKK